MYFCVCFILLSCFFHSINIVQTSEHQYMYTHTHSYTHYFYIFVNRLQHGSIFYRYVRILLSHL